MTAIKSILKLVAGLLTILGVITSSLWGAFIALDVFVVKRAQSEIEPVKTEMRTHYKHINRRLKTIDEKLDKALGL